MNRLSSHLRHFKVAQISKFSGHGLTVIKSFKPYNNHDSTMYYTELVIQVSKFQKPSTFTVREQNLEKQQSNIALSQRYFLGS